MSTLDYKIDMFASLDFAHAYQTCQKCALALSIITVARNTALQGLPKKTKKTYKVVVVFCFNEMTHHYVDDILYPFLEIEEMREITKRYIVCFYLKAQFDIQIAILCTLQWGPIQLNLLNLPFFSGCWYVKFASKFRAANEAQLFTCLRYFKEEI